MDLTTYSTAKVAGQVAFMKLNDAYVLSQKQYDPATGKAVSPKVQAVDRAAVEKQIAALQDQIDALNMLLADIMTLDKETEGV